MCRSIEPEDFTGDGG
jgi:hypothetical protein